MATATYQWNTVCAGPTLAECVNPGDVVILDTTVAAGYGAAVTQISSAVAPTDPNTGF